jgi:hypothetical protein
MCVEIKYGSYWGPKSHFERIIYVIYVSEAKDIVFKISSLQLFLQQYT